VPSIQEMEEEMDKYDRHITTVLSDIVKEKSHSIKPKFPSLRFAANPQANGCSKRPYPQKS